MQWQGVQLNQELHSALLNKLLAALVRGEHAVDQVRRVGHRLHEERGRKLLLTRLFLLGRVRVHSPGRIAGATWARVAVHPRLLHRVLINLGILRMLHGAAAQFHQPTEHVHRESHAHILEAGDVPEQLVQVAADGARSLALQELGVGAGGKSIGERVQGPGLLHPLEALRGERQRAESDGQTRQRVRGWQRRVLLGLFPSRDERLRGAVLLELPVARRLVVHHVAQEVRRKREHPAAEQSGAAEDVVQRQAQLTVVETRGGDVAHPRGEIRERHRAHQSLNQHPALRRHQVHAPLLVVLVIPVLMRRLELVERVSCLLPQPVHHEVQPAELAESRRRGAGVIHENLEHVHRVGHDVQVPRVPVPQQRQQHGEQAHVP